MESVPEIVTATKVIEPFGSKPLTFKELQKMSASKSVTRKYYDPIVKGYIKDWQKNLKPITDESA